MSLESLKPYEDMWTTDVARYRLFLLNGVDFAGGALIYDMVAGGPVLIEAEAELLSEVHRKMLEAGVTPISPDEAAAFSERALIDLLAHYPSLRPRKQPGEEEG